jgi:hypothetical protein
VKTGSSIEQDLID